MRVASSYAALTQDVEVITEDGAPSGRKDSIIWKAPFIDRDSPALGRHSALTEATGLMRFLMKRGVRVILFCKVSSLLKVIESGDDFLN